MTKDSFRLPPSALRPSYDLIVIGGGPAGLQLAWRMSKSGYRTLLLDDRPEIGKRKICTGIISAEAFEEFDLPRNSVLNEIQKLTFVSPRGTELDYDHPSLLALVVDRPAFDHTLGQRAEDAGAEILTGVRGRDISIEDDAVSLEAVSVVDPSERLKIRAKFLAIATGVNFGLNTQAGLGVPDGFLNAVQAHVRVHDLENTHCFAGKNVAPGAFAWMVPLEPGWARIGLMTDDRPAPYFEELVKRIAPYRVDPEETVQASYKPIAQNFKGKTYGHRVLAVGEAAGQVKTTTGGGIYYGILGAEIAAEVLAKAINEDCRDEECLSRYESRWKEAISQELKTGYSYRKTFAALSDGQIESLFKLARINGILPLVKRTARFDWHANVLTSVARYGLVEKALARFARE